MSNVIPAAYVPPNPFHAQPGESIRGAALAKYFAACNWLAATGHSRTVIEQGWDSTMFTGVARADNSEAYVTHWRIPPLSNRVTVECYAYCAVMGAARTTEKVTFKSVIGGDSVDIIPPDSDAFAMIGPVSLTIDASGGYEEVELYLTGGGTHAVQVRGVTVKYPELTGDLAAGADADCIGFDPDEFAADQALSADAMQILIDNIDALIDRHQVYYQWGGIDEDSGYRDGSTSPIMQPYCHRIIARVNHGSIEQDPPKTVRVWIEARNDTGDDQVAVIYHGRAFPSRIRQLGVNPIPTESTVITIPAGSGLDWYSADVRLLESHITRSWPGGMDAAQLTL